jgi:hypothetical protein
VENLSNIDYFGSSGCVCEIDLLVGEAGIDGKVWDCLSAYEIGAR